MDDSQYLKEENNKDSIIKTYQKRITYIYKNCKYYYNYNSSKINNEILETYIPNDKEFYLFILDYLSLKNKELYNNYITYFNFCEDKDKEKDNSEIYMYKTKININIVFLGNEHSGKSTTIGHLLYDTGNLDFNTFQKCKNDAQNLDKYSYRFAWILIKKNDEKKFCHTINTYINKCEVEKYEFSFIDIPGKIKLINNSIKGIFLGDVAVIVVPAEKDAFEKSFLKGNPLKII